MVYLDVCSGISAATVAWKPLGWTACAYAEIEPFPSAVLKHHYPNVPNWGDITKFKEWPDVAVDLLVGGTPCQSFSVAGLRKGLADPRGNLALVFLAIADRYRPQWIVWENVPGVLSVDGGRAFGAFLGGLGQFGYGWAYRSLDAQYAGLAQRRERVFVVAHLGDWRRAAAVLFERHSLQGNPPPRRETGETITGPIAGCSNGGGANWPGRTADDADSLIARPLRAQAQAQAQASHRADSDTYVAHSLRADGFDASEDGTGRGTPIVVSETGAGWWSEGVSALRADPGGMPAQLVAFTCKDYGADAGELAPTLRAGGHSNSHANAGGMPAVAIYDDPRRFDARGIHRGGEHGDLHPPLNTVNAQHFAQINTAVRRLTPRECERLQGFPDDFTLVPYRNKPAADGPRYKALGNSKAVPVVRWIGERIDQVRAA